MMAILAWLALFAGLGSVCTLSYKSHYGTTFDLGMVPMYKYGDPDITLDVASNASGQMTLYIPFLNINRTQIVNNGLTTIKVANRLISRGNFTERSGIHIQSDVPVAVYVTVYKYGIAESYLALPVTLAGSNYILAAFQPFDSNEYSEALVVSSFTNTAVSITTRRQSTATESLNWLDAKQIAEDNDISGTAISANATISVIAGTTCAHVPQNYTFDCGLIVEQMIPIDVWEKEYIVPNMPPRKGVLIRVLTQKHQDVCFYTQRGSTCKQVPYPHPLEFSTGSEPVFVRSDSTISVISYGMEGGPFMISVPGIKNFMNEYYFIVPASYTSYSNSLAVVIQSTQIAGLTLDGSTTNSRNVFNVPNPYDNYKVLIISIATGYHTLRHRNMDVTFGAFLYGHGYKAGYGFALGMQKQTVAEITVEKNTCYYCNEMFHVELCEVVSRCSKNEICYLERFSKHGRQTFRSGCISQQVCLKESESVGIIDDPDRCMYCCSGSYCNHKGCGQTGLPARDQRGPLCYDCEYTFSPHECDTLKLCDEGQVCSIEETRWGTRFNFRMGCAREPCSPLKRSAHVSTRSTPTCHSCCSEDYCNLNCTTGSEHGQPVIVG